MILLNINKNIINSKTALTGMPSLISSKIKIKSSLIVPYNKLQRIIKKNIRMIISANIIMIRMRIESSIEQDLIINFKGHMFSIPLIKYM
jgi:hypothetical protein